MDGLKARWSKIRKDRQTDRQTETNRYFKERKEKGIKP
jgi:hypothetical protein